MGSDALDRVTVAVIEDLDVVLEGVRRWIADDPGHRAVIVAEGSSVDAVMDAGGRDADVIVLDLDLHGEYVTDRVSELADAGHRVIVYSVHSEPLVVQRVLAAGACAFLDKRAERELFVDVIVNARRDAPFVTPSMAGALLEVPKLSSREREALLHLFQGMDYASIARRMTTPDGEQLSVHTVRQYVDRARGKLAAAGRPCRSAFALVATCIEQGLIRADEIKDYRSEAAGPSA
jgi:DNA-binding NarL/FixJ family response regulator